MSVYIKDMEMPPSCRDCPCFCEEYFYCRVKESDDIGLEKLPKDCPLIPVPEHGRLIDADAFEAFIRKDWDKNDHWIADVVYSRPTIIPAEEDE